MSKFPKIDAAAHAHWLLLASLALNVLFVGAAGAVAIRYTGSVPLTNVAQIDRGVAGMVGKARATEMMMLGEKISPEKALDWGMIYKVVEDADLLAESRALATRLANGPTLAYATMRKNILVAMENSYSEQLLAEAEGQRIAGSSEDAAEGGMAFLQKRKPEFKGR